MRHLISFIMSCALCVPMCAQTNNAEGVSIPMYGFYEAVASLDFPITAAGISSDMTISLPGAVLGKVVMLGTPSTAVPLTGEYMAFVSAADVVTIRFSNNNLLTSMNPSAGNFTVMIPR